MHPNWSWNSNVTQCAIKAIFCMHFEAPRTGSLVTFQGAKWPRKLSYGLQAVSTGFCFLKRSACFHRDFLNAAPFFLELAWVLRCNGSDIEFFFGLTQTTSFVRPKKNSISLPFHLKTRANSRKTSRSSQKVPMKARFPFADNKNPVIDCLQSINDHWGPMTIFWIGNSPCNSVPKLRPIQRGNLIVMFITYRTFSPNITIFHPC